jgi:hypothetical protein
MIYKVNFSEENTKTGRKPSKFRTKVDRTLAVMEPKSSFTVWNKTGMSAIELANRLATYASVYENKNYGTRFTTKRYSYGVKVTREE